MSRIVWALSHGSEMVALLVVVVLDINVKNYQYSAKKKKEEKVPGARDESRLEPHPSPPAYPPTHRSLATSAATSTAAGGGHRVRARGTGGRGGRMAARRVRK